MDFTNSQIKAFQRCKRQHWYKFDVGLIPRHAELPLKRGSWLHELLEAKYRGESWRQANEELAIEFYKMFEEERERYGDLPKICEHIMESYEYRWREEDAEFQVVAVEEEYAVKVPHGHTMKFKIDALVQDEMGLWLMEHKSHKTIPDDDYRFLDIQSAKYVWGLQKLGYDIIGVLWNYLCTIEPKRPELLKDGSRLSKRKIRTDLFTFVDTLKEYDLDPHDYRSDILALRDYNSFFRRERVPKPKKVIETLMKEAIYTADEIERGYQPVRSIDRSCSYLCSYMDLCEVSLYGGDTTSLERSRYQPASTEDYYGYTEKSTE